jgi:gas vesicle protein
MSQTPEEIRADIERTRRELGTDVDALADKVSPSGIAHRQTSKVKDGIRRAKENVMGTADETTSGVRDTLHQTGDSTRESLRHAGEAVQDAPQQALRQTQGNPLAAGLIAFGVGMLVSSLIPPSEAERQAAQTVKEKAEPLTHEVSDVAQQVAQDLKEPAREAAEHVKTAAAEGSRHVKDDAQTAAGNVKDSATEATDTVRGSQGT